MALFRHGGGQGEVHCSGMLLKLLAIPAAIVVIIIICVAYAHG